MNILVLSDNYPPEMNANARIVSELLEHWAQSHSVTVLTCHPNFPRGKIFNTYKNQWLKKSSYKDVNIIRVKTYMHPNSGFFRRSLDFFSFGLVSFCVGLFQKNADIIIGVTPQFFAALSACCLALIKKRPFVMILCDLWPDSIVANRLMKKNWLYKIIKKIEYWMYHKATSIVILSRQFRKYLHQAGIADNKIFTSISGVSKQFYPRPKNPAILTHYNLKDKFVIGYIGSFGISHGHHDILLLAESLRNTSSLPFHFLILGDGAKRAELLQQKNDRGLDNVSIDGPFSADCIPDYWSVIDIAIVPLANTPTNKTVLPSKILEAFAMGIPIVLYAPDGEAKKFLAETQAGWYVSVGDLAALKKQCVELLTQNELMSDKKKRTFSVASQFTREQQANDLLAHLETIYDVI
ncbi:MAG: glycosyltransferase family 4 protein [Candidatus Aquirickettsiella sp.]